VLTGRHGRAVLYRTQCKSVSPEIGAEIGAEDADPAWTVGNAARILAAVFRQSYAHAASTVGLRDETIAQRKDPLGVTQKFATLVYPAVRTGLGLLLGMLLVTTPAGAQTPAEGQPRTGGTARIGYWLGPPTLNPYFTTSYVSRTLSELTLESLAGVAPDGSYFPILASEVPTQANGDVSADGTVVTWKLKPGLIWSDGQPFTSHDVVFTYRLLLDPANPVLSRTDYAIMESVTAPDDTTVVVTYKQLYGAYRLAFPFVFPAHVFNDNTSIAADPFNRGETVGTGPFVFQSATNDDTITFARNPNYREPDRPYLDQVIARVIPGRDATVQALAAGDLDASTFLDATNLAVLATLSDVSVDPIPYGDYALYVNASCSSGPRQGDPSCPNAVLGDVRVRQAIELAIDKQALVRGLLADRVSVDAALLANGVFKVDLPPSDFNPDAARALLDQTGWLVGADGIRAKSGVRAHLGLLLTAGDSLGEQTAQVVQGDLHDVGIETDIKESGTSLGGGFAANSPFNLGNFDLALYTGINGSATVDPQMFLQSHYASDQIPDPTSQTGNNWDRTLDARLDQALAVAGNTLDFSQRQAAYATASELMHADEAIIPLYPQLKVDARKSYLKGWGPANPNGDVTWNVQDWWLDK
jgi:peptide/nickel transport system substrate-binding protein